MLVCWILHLYRKRMGMCIFTVQTTSLYHTLKPDVPPPPGVFTPFLDMHHPSAVVRHFFLTLDQCITEALIPLNVHIIHQS